MNLQSDCLVRYARLDDCLAGGNPRAPHFGEEARQLDRIADAGRRRQWLAGRAVARELLRDTFGFNRQDNLEIISRNDNGLGMRPLVVANGCQIECGLSISHTPRGVLVALGPKNDYALGVDLCDGSESFTPGFLRLWFTTGEQSWIAGDRRRAAIVWSIKEAVFKAVSQGAPWNPRDIEVHSVSEPDAPGAETSALFNAFRCDYRSQAVTPLSLALRLVDGHTAAIACLSPNATIQFSVPLPSAREPQQQATTRSSIAANYGGRHLIPNAATVPPIEY
jgi:phosphopantetheinyl transferase